MKFLSNNFVSIRSWFSIETVGGHPSVMSVIVSVIIIYTWFYWAWTHKTSSKLINLNQINLTWWIIPLLATIWIAQSHIWNIKVPKTKVILVSCWYWLSYSFSSVFIEYTCSANSCNNSCAKIYTWTRKVCESGYTKKRNKMLSNTMLWDVNSIKTYVIASLCAWKRKVNNVYR